MIKKSILSIVTALILLTGTTWAASLSEAKQQGYLGEQPNGYIGIVVNSAPVDVKKMARSVNAQRKRYYEGIAKSNGIPLGEVQTAAGQKTIQRLPKGEYYRDIDGGWVRK